MDKKRIVIVTHSAANGGAERVSCTLANQFAMNGHDVTLYAIHSDNRQYFLHDAVHYHFGKINSKNKVFKAIERAWKLSRYVKDQDFDVAISFVCLEGLFLTSNKKTKKIFSLRNDPAHVDNTGLARRLRNYIYKKADNIVFQTPDARDFFEEEIRNKGVVIPNPIREGLPFWKEEGYNNDIIAACRISKQKNLKMMLDAFKLFSAQNDQYRLVIYGKGDLQSHYEKYAKEIGLEENVVFPGFCNSIQDKMKDAAMYVSSSDYEGISNSMLEALAIGIPTVCTDCPIGGAGMFIRSGKNGFLVPVNDASAMAERMLELANDRELQMKFSLESRKLREELTETRIYRKWEELV